MAPGSGGTCHPGVKTSGKEHLARGWGRWKVVLMWYTSRLTACCRGILNEPKAGGATHSPGGGGGETREVRVKRRYRARLSYSGPALRGGLGGLETHATRSRYLTTAEERRVFGLERRRKHQRRARGAGTTEKLPENCTISAIVKMGKRRGNEG